MILITFVTLFHMKLSNFGGIKLVLNYTQKCMKKI